MLNSIDLGFLHGNIWYFIDDDTWPNLNFRNIDSKIYRISLIPVIDNESRATKTWPKWNSDQLIHQNVVKVSDEKLAEWSNSFDSFLFYFWKYFYSFLLLLLIALSMTTSLLLNSTNRIIERTNFYFVKCCSTWLD